jgi:hypothetical protein
MTVVTSIENLIEGIDGSYSYFDNTEWPLHIEAGVNEGRIEVTVIKYFKGNTTKEKTYKSKITDTMSQYQIEEYILDCVELFLNKK